MYRKIGPLTWPRHVGWPTSARLILGDGYTLVSLWPHSHRHSIKNGVATSLIWLEYWGVLPLLINYWGGGALPLRPPSTCTCIHFGITLSPLPLPLLSLHTIKWVAWHPLVSHMLVCVTQHRAGYIWPVLNWALQERTQIIIPTWNIFLHRTKYVAIGLPTYMVT